MWSVVWVVIQLKVFVCINLGLCGSRFGYPRVRLTGFDLAQSIQPYEYAIELFTSGAAFDNIFVKQTFLYRIFSSYLHFNNVAQSHHYL